MLSVVKRASSNPPSAAKFSEGNSLENPVLERPARGQEMSFTVEPAPGESISESFARLADAVEGATILNMLVFGATSASAAAIEVMQRRFGRMDWPLTWVEGGACRGRGAIAGIQAWTFDGGPVERLQLEGRVVGSVFEEGGARHCLVGGLGPRKHSLCPGDQTKQTLERLEIALAQGGFWLADMVRTWFFLENILSWYDAFNAARTEIYSGVKFRTGSLPASTGVGARNRFDAALAVAARAMQPLNGHARAVETASPLQCPAPAYGSSFSRAMEISTANGRQLLISGTASIAPGGETAWQNDITRQVDCTMKVVEAILESRGFTLRDLTRAVAYFKHTNYAGAFAEWCRANELTVPVVTAHCDVCRDDLLFELEADAGKAN